jgi:hypothetical protein
METAVAASGRYDAGLTTGANSSPAPDQPAVESEMAEHPYPNRRNGVRASHPGYEASSLGRAVADR